MCIFMGNECDSLIWTRNFPKGIVVNVAGKQFFIDFLYLPTIKRTYQAKLIIYNRTGTSHVKPDSKL